MLAGRSSSWPGEVSLSSAAGLDLFALIGGGSSSYVSETIEFINAYHKAGSAALVHVRANKARVWAESYHRVGRLYK